MLNVKYLIVGFAALCLSATVAVAQTDAAPKPAETAEALPEMSIGDPKAPVTLIEYSSLACPSCAAFHKDVLPKLKTEYIDKGKVRYVMREFPHNEAALGGAVVARCIDQSKFFPFVEMLFQKQPDWAFKDDALTPLKEYAKQAGLPEEQFNKCLDDESLQKKILAVRNDGSKKGVRGTPSVFVNGVIVRGTSYDKLVEAMKPYLGS